MRKFPIVLDIETKRTFRECKDPAGLGITVVAVYDYADKKEKIFLEEDLNSLFPLLENASYIIGYNSRSFDLPVIQGYYPGNVDSLSQFDILEDIRSRIGRRISLNDVVSCTLGKKKTGHGLMAIEYYKNGEWDKLIRYCMDDTLLTMKLFEYGIDNGEIFFESERGKTPIKVQWKKYIESEGENNEVVLTLPF